MKTVVLCLFAAASLSTAFADSVSVNATVTCNPASCVSPDGMHFASGNGGLSGTLDSSNFTLSLDVNANAMGSGSFTVPVGGPLFATSLVMFSFDVEAIGNGPGTLNFE